MFKTTMGLLLALILVGCSSTAMIEDNAVSSSKNNTDSYFLTKEDIYLINIYSEHINVILLKDKKSPSLEKLYFTLKARVKFIEVKTQDNSLTSLQIMRDIFLKWWINYRFSGGDFSHMEKFVDSTVKSIKHELKQQAGTSDVDLAQSEKQMAIELVTNVADFYYCEKMGLLKISFYHQICDKYDYENATKQQRRKKVYDDFVKHQRELNNL